MIRWKIALLILLVTTMAAGGTACQTGNRSYEGSDLNDQHITLRIAANQNTKFMKRFHQAIEIYFPKWTIQVVDTLDRSLSGKSWEDWLNQNNIDLIFADNPATFRELANSGLLTPLDEWIQRDGFSLDTVVPGVVAWHRHQAHDEKLYGIANPEFRKPMISRIGFEPSSHEL